MEDNWDDLRILLAVVKNGSITAGAKELRLDQSTVSRRLMAFEQRMGHQLFLEGKKRDKLTAFGEACVLKAQNIFDEMQKLHEEIKLTDQGFEGNISILAGDILSDHLLLSICHDFLKSYPKINLRLSRKASLSGRLESDIALFATNEPNEELWGKRLATATFATYASQNLIDEAGLKPEKLTWLNWDDGTPTPTWPALAPNIPDEMCRLRCTSVETLLEGVRNGLGATILPCYIGEKDPLLHRLSPGEIVSKRDIWVLVRPDMRKIPKIRAFLDYLYEKIKSNKRYLECE